MSIYVLHIENGVLKKYIPGLFCDEITVPENVHTIAAYCFSPWQPETLPIGEDLNHWDEYFTLKTIHIPKNIKHIEPLAFADVTNLKKIGNNNKIFPFHRVFKVYLLKTYQSGFP